MKGRVKIINGDNFFYRDFFDIKDCDSKNVLVQLRTPYNPNKPYYWMKVNKSLVSIWR